MRGIKYYYGCLILFVLFELSRVYFIMPFPGSQESDTIDIAYWLNSNRWIFRVLLGSFILYHFSLAYKRSKPLTLASLSFALFSFGFIQLNMMADTMFYPPKNLILKSASESKIPLERQIIGIELNGQAKAYPISFLAYHHQVYDQIDQQEIMISYCSVCRSGRVFIPKINGKSERFRLVGMDQFNALFEDQTTGSWWRQENGESIKGPLKGQFLQEFPSQQSSLGEWLKQFPNSLIMQEDPDFISAYDSQALFEQGKSKGSLTKTDSSSWAEKSWVVGLTLNNESIAIDWNTLKSERLIITHLNHQNILVAMKPDLINFSAFITNQDVQNKYISGDSLFLDSFLLDFECSCLKDTLLNRSFKLTPLQSYQEFWHSWKTFHPGTKKY